jgi:hypothetical protein
MTLTPEEIAKVLRMYYGCECETIAPDGIPHQIHETINYYWLDRSARDGTVLKPFLRPLSAITDEDAIEVAKILRSPHAVYHLSDPKNMIESAKYWIQWGLIAVFTNNGVANHFAYQYLISKSYAVPLFFSPGHWANGKDAIALGIAIDKSNNSQSTQ